jgi:glycerophosphoryl diester phosphodiesterase
MVDHQLSSDFVEQSWPVIVAHRGASRTYPENTLEAFEAAIAVGADVVELDVRLTSDGVPVVLHDVDVSHTTDGTGAVSGMTLAEVKRLNAAAGPRSSGVGRPRAEVPTLREALEVLSGRAGIDIEIKNIPGEPDFDSPTEAVAGAVVNLLDGFGFRSGVLVSSFNWLSIDRVKELDRGVRTGFLTTKDVDARDALVYAREHGHEFVLPHVEALLMAGDAFPAEAHAGFVRVGTWTVDDLEIMERLFGWGVDAVATNDPGRAAALRDRFRSG